MLTNFSTSTALRAMPVERSGWDNSEQSISPEPSLSRLSNLNRRNDAEQDASYKKNREDRPGLGSLFKDASVLHQLRPSKLFPGFFSNMFIAVHAFLGICLSTRSSLSRLSSPRRRKIRADNGLSNAKADRLETPATSGRHTYQVTIIW